MLFLRLNRIAADHRRRRPMVVLGTLAGIAAIVFVGVLSVWNGVAALPLLPICLGACLLQAIVYLGIPWQRVPRVAILVVPAVWLGGLAACGLAIGPLATNFAGLPILAFLFAGLTQARWRSLWLLPVSVPAWLTLVTETGATIVRLWLPVALILWIVIAEATAYQTNNLRREMRRLHREVDLDPLTRLASRRVLPEVLRDVADGDVLVLIDVDHFKSINDTHGHAAGDQVLKEFGRMLLRCLGPHDVAIRYGGEELLVVLAHPTPQAVTAFDRSLRREVLEIRPRVSFTAGVSRVVPDESVDDALARADATLYEMKSAGRNRAGGDIGPRDVTHPAPDSRPAAGVVDGV